MNCPHCGQHVPVALQARLDTLREWKQNRILWADAMRRLVAAGYTAEQAAQVLANA